MLLYLIRHAHAESAASDTLRPLSPAGQQAVRRLVAGLRAAGAFHPVAVWHSPLRRAKETAELLVAGAGHGPMPILEVDGLLPEDDPADLASRLWHCSNNLAVIGHEPFLSSLATFLVTGRVAPTVFSMEKGAALCLERPEDDRPTARWRCRWHLVPEMFPPVS